jgi:hypothetical protein
VESRRRTRPAGTPHSSPLEAPGETSYGCSSAKRERDARDGARFFADPHWPFGQRHRQAVAELLTRLNFGLTIGNFELDFDDGEVRYRSSVDVEGTELTSELIKPLAAAAVLNMDYYLPGIRAVATGDATPLEAFAALEGTESP